jgi:hypothetical protein
MDLKIRNLVVDLQHHIMVVTADLRQDAAFQAPIAGGPAYPEVLDDASYC